MRDLLAILLLVATGIYLICQSFVTSASGALMNFLIIVVSLSYLTGIYSHIKEVK